MTASLHRARRTLTAAVLGVVLLAGSLAGCVATQEASDFSVTPFSGEQAPAVTEDQGAGGFAESSSSDAATQAESVTTREIVTTGFATITVEDPAAAADDAVRIVETAGGRVDSRSELAATDGAEGRASLILRIPAAQLTATLDGLRDLGTEVSVSISAQDVTVQAQDLDARITALTTSVDRLLNLLATATETSVLIEVETALSARQGELESLQAQRRLLSDQVAMSLLNLELVSVADTPLQAPASFWDALMAGLSAFGGFMTAVFLGVGFLLPWLVLVGLLAGIALLVLRRRKQKT
jgi:hypothetical protein